MNIPTKEAISFNLFYLIEFFNITLNKIEGKIADSHYNLLKDLCGYLLKEDTIVKGLEYIARYQTTNDLAIFLFDMMERVNDYGPVVIYNTLPDLADDFQNLYALLIEEEDNVTALQGVVGEFREKFGELEKEKQLVEFVDMVNTEKVEHSPELSFKQFYLQELLNQIDSRLEKTAESKDFLNVISTFITFSSTEQQADMAFSAEIEKTRETIQSGLPGEKSSPGSLYKNLDKNAKKIISAVEKFKQKSAEHFDEILKTSIIKPLESKPQEKTEEHVEHEEKTKLDSLLVEYFKTEVEDSVDDFKKFVDKSGDNLNDPENIDAIVKRFKNLKEVSMIHGYGGLEHLSSILAQKFAELPKSSGKINEQSIKILYGIFDELVTVEKFVEKTQSRQQVELVKEKIDDLEKSFLVKVEDKVEKTESTETTPEPQVVEESEGPAEAKEALQEIAITDRAEFIKVIQSFFSVFIPKVVEHHKDLKVAANQNFIKYALNILKINSSMFHPEFNEQVTQPLHNLYNRLLVDKNLSAEQVSHLENIWNALKDKPLDNTLLQLISDQIAGSPAPEEKDTGIDDDKTVQAFLESIVLLWKKQKDSFLKTLEEGNESNDSNSFVQKLEKNLNLLKLENYYPFTNFIKEIISQSVKNPLKKEVTSELDSTFDLFFDRIRLHGKKGNCDDIISALQDTISETSPMQAQTEETVEELQKEPAEPEVPAAVEQPKEAEDDLSLFRDETKEYLKTIDTNLKEFNKSKERTHLTEIENALHSVRSAAHYLNLQDITKLAATIEDAAEMFGQSDLPMPDNLATELRIGVETLENLISNPETEFSATMDMMESLVDHIVIEDMGKSESESDDADVAEQAEDDVSQVEEKPLFADGQNEDAELLEIFKEESGTFINDILEHNKKLLEDPANKKVAKEMGYAAHSLKSAAKMLGFREISQITDGLEILTEAISNNEIEHTSELHNTIDRAVEILKDLSENKEVESPDISKIVNSLAPASWKKDATTSDEEEDDQLPENMVEVFVDEARELIGGLNNDYLELEKMPESEMILSNIARRMHTLKGSSYISKYNVIGDLAHKLEDFIQLYTQKDSDTKNEMLDSLFVSLDLISEMVDSISETGKEKIDDLTTRLAEIDNKMFLFQNFSTAQTTIEKQVPAIEPQPTRISSKKGEDESIIKISTEYMDKLVDMASELMINQTQLGAHLHSLKEILNEIEGEKRQIHGAENILEDAIEFGVLKKEEKDTDPEKSEEVKKISDNIKDVVRAVNMIHSDLNTLTEGFEQNIGRISSISKLLHSDMLKTRMVPVEQLFNRYPRAVRDISHKQNKKVNLVIEDNNTEMDRAMVEGLSEPILHIIRNAIDHGIELPEERKELNKSETGALILKAHQEKNQIVINIEDDGRGIDIETIRSKIIEKEIADKAQVDRMSEAEVLDYIFYPGFTTKDEATDTSGRGIGLDAVANQLQKLKGNIRIKTEKNVGTSFNLRVPLTLVISQALMVKVNLQSIAIPVIAVQESVQYKQDDLVADGKKQYIRVRGRLLPFIHLKDILKFNEAGQFGNEKPIQLAVVIHDAGVSMALGIDELVGRQEVVIKSLGSHLQNVDYISGGTILANGDVALILDYALVIRTIEMHFFGKMTEKQQTRTVRKEDGSKAQSKAPAEKEGNPSVPKNETVSKEKTTPGRVIIQKSITDRKPKIIVVDDSNSVRNFVGSILERSGFIAIKSTNGADALDKMKSEKVDLIITDLEMPKMHGFDLISNIRALDKYDDLPIIILTGRAGMKHRQTGEELGANAFIVKPFKEKDLLQSLAKFIKTEEFE